MHIGAQVVHFHEGRLKPIEMLMRLAGYARRRQICNMIPLTIVYVQLVQICRVFSNEIQNHFQLWCNNGLTRDKQKGKLRFIIT